MVHRLVLGALLAAGLLAAPAHASTSSRIDVKLRAAERALDRASSSDDAAGIASALSSARRNLASATKTALRKPSPQVFGRVAAVDGDAVTTTVALFDGQSGDTVTALSTTLKAALDGRDSIVAAINALADKSDYARVLDRIHADATDEATDIADTLLDDELTDEAKTALNAAATQVGATAAAAPATSDDSDDADYPVAGRDCPDRGDDPIQTAGGPGEGRGFGGPRGGRRG
jgi:hypothetical protein